MQLVRVRLRKPRRVFNFLSYDLVLKRADACIVQSDRGLEWGEVILPPEPIVDDSGPRTTMRVIRRVNEEDQQTQGRLEEEEKKAYALCLEKIRERKMGMKLVDVEYTFDKKKVIFYFTAEDRVDFRDLVRDLAQILKTRIELRHIQVRDEAKMVGGIGGCGRELCCSTWLNEFKPISMRMAKSQNLALNPSKISGQCGRLLCCLSYEHELYEEMKRLRKTERDDRRRKEAETEAEDDAALEKDLDTELKALEERREQTARVEKAPPPPPPSDSAGANGSERDEGDKRRRTGRKRRRRKPREEGGAPDSSN
jgi:cell fate regulator YaaT (PSP1 superfamily)